MLKFSLDYFKFGDANVKEDGINETFVPVRFIYWKYMVEHAKTVRKSTISDLAKEASSFITRVKWALLE